MQVSSYLPNDTQIVFGNEIFDPAGAGWQVYTNLDKGHCCSYIFPKGIATYIHYVLHDHFFGTSSALFGSTVA